MSGLLVSNGSSLYRRDGSLVRSPISVVIEATDYKYYPFAGNWRSSTGEPTGGWWASSSMSSVNAQMQNVRNCWRNPDSRMNWRDINTGHLPENIFYMGRWATSAPADQGRGEAYMQVAAYQFALPSISGLNLVGAKLIIYHGGEIVTYQNPNYSSATQNNFYGINWDATTARANTWRSSFEGTGWGEPTWIHSVGVYPSLAYIRSRSCGQLCDEAQDEITLNTGLAIGGTPRGYRKIWTDTDFGCIPIASNPYTQEYQLSQDCVDALSTNGGGWVITFPNVTSVAPDFDCPNLYYWFCEAHWGYKLRLEYE